MQDKILNPTCLSAAGREYPHRLDAYALRHPNAQVELVNSGNAEQLSATAENQKAAHL
jgi:hypothetical protein